jgi:hypothetical protein
MQFICLFNWLFEFYKGEQLISWNDISLNHLTNVIYCYKKYVINEITTYVIIR